jgi:hypothetical protein
MNGDYARLAELAKVPSLLRPRTGALRPALTEALYTQYVTRSTRLRVRGASGWRKGRRGHSNEEARRPRYVATATYRRLP